MSVEERGVVATGFCRHIDAFDKARFPALRKQRKQRKVLHKKRNVRKKWPMTWLEFVT